MNEDSEDKKGGLEDLIDRINSKNYPDSIKNGISTILRYSVCGFLPGDLQQRIAKEHDEKPGYYTFISGILGLGRSALIGYQSYMFEQTDPTKGMIMGVAAVGLFIADFFRVTNTDENTGFGSPEGHLLYYGYYRLKNLFSKGHDEKGEERDSF